MFISDKLIFLELQKTGCTHIRNLLKNILSGKISGNHNGLSKKPQGKYIIGSIRDPWEWYVSLWAFGCMGRGALRGHLAPNRNSLIYLLSLISKMSDTLLHNNNHNNPLKSDAFLILIKKYKRFIYWSRLYDDVNDIKKFRKWLRSMLKDKKIDLQEGYSSSCLNNFAGFMTFRYFRVFYPQDIKKSFMNINNLADLRSFDKRECPIDFFIRNESIELDTLKMLKLTGHNINKNMKSIIFSDKRLNQSKHMPYNRYYDESTAALVYEKERFIIEKFGYKPPTVTLES